MKNEKLISSAIIAAALVIAGFALRSGIITFKDRDCHVSVKGLSEKEVKADKVTWALVYKEIGNDPTEMYGILEKKNAQIVQFLKAGGVKDSEISINPPSINDRQADNYGNDLLNYRYKAKSVITVTSSDVEKVRTLMRRQSELMKQGIAIVCEEYGENNVEYEFTDLNKIKPEMVEEATANARSTAEKFAEDSGSGIGRILHANQGQFSIEDRDATTPYIKTIRVVVTMDYQLD
ncbi:MAG: SIMPL domain-containing protein [Bacteroidaceae bacterium]|nr:SIMPL domain-containing protein [Bacteroidaceae bacterium]